ncbi:MAG: hypothetical protein U9P10_11425 [Thermodesulfobacteriota bacterium]|nr:hypothetical protein [Thermodesulfobacteriota bacterium]
MKKTGSPVSLGIVHHVTQIRPFIPSTQSWPHFREIRYEFDHRITNTEWKLLDDLVDK